MSSHYNNQDPNTGYYGPPSQDYYNTSANPSEGFSFDMSATDFGVEQQFGSFEYNSVGQQREQEVGSSPLPPSKTYDSRVYEGQNYVGSILTPQSNVYEGVRSPSNFGEEDEPPLMEELGINFDHIFQKTMAALNPMKETDTLIMHDTDLAGPLVFCLAFGGFLLLSGKIHFGYIYGLGVMGCLSMYALLNLMSLNGVSVGCTVSVLGYCLLPMVALSGISILLSLKGFVGIVLAIITIFWCSLSASKLFVTALTMDHQQLLVAYPCALVYGVFVLLTVF